MKPARDLQLGDTIYSCCFDEIYGTFHLDTHKVTDINSPEELVIRVTIDRHEHVDFLSSSMYTQTHNRVYLTTKERVSEFLNSAIKEMGKNIENMLNYAQALELGDLNESNIDWKEDQDDKDILDFISKVFA